MGIDIFLFEYIFNLTGNYWVDFLGHFFAKFLPYALIIILILFSIKDRVFYSKIVLHSIILGFLVRYLILSIIEYFIPRNRPFMVYGFDPLIPREPSPSFPSAHAAFFFLISTIIFFKNKKLGFFLYFSSFLISLSRIYTGVHWPSDVFTGALIGVIVGLIYQKAVLYFDERN